MYRIEKRSDTLELSALENAKIADIIHDLRYLMLSPIGRLISGFELKKDDDGVLGVRVAGPDGEYASLFGNTVVTITETKTDGVPWRERLKADPGHFGLGWKIGTGRDTVAEFLDLSELDALGLALYAEDFPIEVLKNGVIVSIETNRPIRDRAELWRIKHADGTWSTEDRRKTPEELMKELGGDFVTKLG